MKRFLVTLPRNTKALAARQRVQPLLTRSILLVPPQSFSPTNGDTSFGRTGHHVSFTLRNLSGRWKEPGPHDQEILDLLDTGRIDYNQLHAAFARIFQETRVELQLETFFKLVQRFQRYKDSQTAEVIPPFLLGWMMKFHKEKRLDRPPKVDIFGMALNCIAKSKHEQAGEIAEQSLNEVEKLIHQGDLGIKIDVTLYNQTIKAFAIRGNSKKAQAIFDRCMKELEEGNEGARPDIFSWNTLIDAHAKSGRPNAGRLALGKLREAEKSLENGILKERLDTISYSAVIDAFARSNEPEEAEQILEEMNKVYLDGNTDAQPNIRSFNAVLNSWARTKTVDGARRSEKILNRMVKLFEDATLPVRPNTVSYNTVISAYGRVGLPKDAGKILEKQNSDFLDGNHDAQPDVQGFLGVIEGWFNSGESIAGEQAERILDHMEGLHKNGTLKDRPQAHIYNAVMKAWGTVGEPKRAEKIFRRMMDDFKNGNLAAKPNATSYNTLMNAWGRAGEWKRAAEIFHRQMDDFKSGYLAAKPNAISFATLLDAYARAKLPNAGELADGVLEQMKQMRVEPHLPTYKSAHKCWHCSKTSDPQREHRLRELDSQIDRMKKKN